MFAGVMEAIIFVEPGLGVQSRQQEALVVTKR